MDIGPLAIAAPAGRRLSQAASQRTPSIAETICMPTAAAPVSHQIRRHQSETSAIDAGRNLGKINESNLCPPAHNGLVTGSNPSSAATLRRSVPDTWVTVY